MAVAFGILLLRWALGCPRYRRIWSFKLDNVLFNVMITYPSFI